MTNAAFSEKPDKYGYFKLADGSVDIFIRIFDHEETNDDGEVSYIDRKSTRLNSSHMSESRMPSSA